jgi:hypothetical protein
MISVTTPVLQEHTDFADGRSCVETAEEIKTRVLFVFL